MPKPKQPNTGIARALSKLGYCSRSQAIQLVREGRVNLNGKLCRNPEAPVRLKTDRLAVDGQPIVPQPRVYVMLNKPRGLVTTASDERGRSTVYDCLAGRLPYVAPVGRLDKASEGILLLTNDSGWAARILAPETHLEKTYHVQISTIADARLLQAIVTGIDSDGDFLKAVAARSLREGNRNSWVEIVLDEGKNRHIRRLLEALGIGVLRLVRVAIGPLTLGDLAKGAFRGLSKAEKKMLDACMQKTSG
ncbi:MAG TPA: pseudouridine synthase [Terriglobales bacterium]